MHPKPPPPRSLPLSLLDAPPFSPAQCEALFAAVLIDDRVDPDTSLPEAIHLDYTREQCIEAYRLCRQVLKEGVDRRRFARMVAMVGLRCALDDEDQRAFKHIRAKFKHLRFAYANFDERHRYPYLFNLITRLMGHLQDAFKTGRMGATRGYALLLRLMLTRPCYFLIARQIDRYYPSSAESFRANILQQIGELRHVLAKDGITSREFHETRKIVSRIVALYDSLRTLYPSSYHDRISRYLSAINGLMGGMHDDLILRKFDDRDLYHVETFALPEDIRRRLHALTERFPAPRRQSHAAVAPRIVPREEMR